MLKTIHVVLTLICFSLAVLAQDASLWVSRCKAGERYCDTREIVRFDFANGELKASEMVFSSNETSFRVDRFRVIDGRYLVGDRGYVADLKTGKVMRSAYAQILSVRDKKVVFGVYGKGETGIYSFDLETGREEKLRGVDKWIHPQESDFSPDGRLVVDLEYTDDFKRKITFWSVDDRFDLSPLKTVTGQFNAHCGVRCSDIATLPIVWIDNTKILTQRTNGELVTIDVSGKVEDVARKMPAKAETSRPLLWRDEFANLFYNLDDKIYLVDLAGNGLLTDRLPMGNGFSRTSQDLLSSKYFYLDTPLGTESSHRGIATKNYLAVEYVFDDKVHILPDSVKVWNTIKKDWTIVPGSRSVELIGWTK